MISNPSLTLPLFSYVAPPFGELPTPITRSLMVNSYGKSAVSPMFSHLLVLKRAIPSLYTSRWLGKPWLLSLSAEALHDRIQDCKCRASDEGKHGGKTIANKIMVDTAVKECSLVEHVLVLQRTGNKVPWTEGRDKWWHEETRKVPNYCHPEIMSSEDPLFILYVRRSCLVWWMDLVLWIGMYFWHF